MCGRCIEDCCAARSIVSGAEVVCAGRRGGVMKSNMS